MVLVAAGWLGAMFLGVLQGLTEFLPVSSSGHLVLFQEFIEVSGDEVAFDLLLHVGTLVPAVWFYRADVLRVFRDAVAGEGPWMQRPGVRLGLLILVATVPTGLIGVGLKDFFQSMFDTPATVALAFAATGLLLHFTAGMEDGELDERTMPWHVALLVGLAQGIAITPGISRSGATIATAMLLGVRREVAMKFSFLLSVPAISGAVLLKLDEVEGLEMSALEAGAGTLAALVTGYLALSLLVRLVVQGRFAAFRWYLWAVAAFTAGVALWHA